VLVLFLIVVGVGVGILEGFTEVVVPTAAALLALDLLAAAWVARSHPRVMPHVHPAIALELAGAGLIAAVIGYNMPAAHGLLPMLLIPALRIGEYAGRALASWTVACLFPLIFILDRFVGTQSSQTDRTSTLLWLVIALITGLVGARVATMERDQEESTPRAAQEAAALLRRLDTLAGSMDAGFDVPASAEMMLEALRQEITLRRSAVLVGTSDNPAVPLALRGSDRVPWPGPEVEGSPLQHTWSTGEAVVEAWQGDTGSRTVLTVAIRDTDGRSIGVLVADREGSLPFNRHDVAVVEDIVHQHGPNLDVALSFAALREHAGMEERERLAREMHDGIAQELVAFGYQIDMVRRQYAENLPHLPNPMDGLRTDLTHVLSGLRLRIADLRVAVRPDQGLGAVISSRLQRFGTSSDLSIALRLNETGFRLPAHTETLLYRLFLKVLDDARHAPGATALDVNLSVTAPQAFLRITHDGASELHQRIFQDHPINDLGGQVIVDRLPGTGVVVQVALHGTPRRAPQPLTNERMPLR
jgi:signal transduction histidine kinase